MAQDETLVEFLTLLAGGFFILLIAMGASFYALNVSRKRIIASEKDKSERALAEKSKLLKASIEGGELERTKIAEELHDQINSQLTVVRMAMARSNQDEILTSAVTTLDDTIQDLRTMSRDLMPPVLERFGLLDALDDLFGRIEKQTGLHIDFEAPEEWATKDVQRDLAFYRIVQEFCQNTMKYAEATEVRVRVELNSSEIVLELRDDGKGYDPAKVELGIGMRNVFSRAEYLKASVELRPKPGEGVYLCLRTPYSPSL